MKHILTSLAILTSFALLTPARGGEVAEVTLTAHKVQFLYDIKEFTVKAGQKVKLKLINPQESVTKQPHNVLIVKPGKKTAVGMAANQAVSDPEFLTTKQCIPDSDAIMHHTSLVQPGEEEVLEFTAPEKPGDYPYLCTYPGHWALMNGVMHVE